MRTQPEADRCIHYLTVDFYIGLLKDPRSIVYVDATTGAERTVLEVERMRRAIRGQVIRHRQRAGFTGIITGWPEEADAPFEALKNRPRPKRRKEKTT